MKKKVIKKELPYPKIDIPGSKSVTNRALLLASLSPQKITLKNPLISDDTISMISCLKTLGAKITKQEEKIIIEGTILKTSKKHYLLDSGLSGTTMRFLLPIICAIPGEKILTGQDGLLKRPIKELVEALRSIGADITYLGKEGFAPLLVRESKLNGKMIVAKGSKSSQYISSLLMLLPVLNGGKLQVADHLVSKPYVDLTIHLMEEFGVTVKKQKNSVFSVSSKETYKRTVPLTVEGDYSSACYFAALAAITSSTVELQNMNPKSKQGDKKFFSILKEMGNDVEASKSSIVIKGKKIMPITVDMESCPDQIQTLAVLAAFAHGKTIVSGIQTLALKETNRVKAVRQELKKMGIKTSATKETLTIYGGAPKSTEIETYGDHRMAMSFAIAQSKLPSLKIKNPEVVAKTFPEFWQKLEKIKL